MTRRGWAIKFFQENEGGGGGGGTIKFEGICLIGLVSIWVNVVTKSGSLM
jgi:hypothetical protein